MIKFMPRNLFCKTYVIVSDTVSEWISFGLTFYNYEQQSYCVLQVTHQLIICHFKKN